MSRKPNLTALVGSRICHDLISPMGAIGNGVELLELSGMAKTPEIALIEESVQAANARLKFFRIAYGNATEGQNLSRAEISSTLASVARGGKLSYFWDIDDACEKRDVRVVFLLLQCLERAMPYGGDIHISRGGTSWVINAEAQRFKLDDELWGSLSNPRMRPQFEPSDVQFALLPEAIEDLNRQLRIGFEATQIRITF